MVRVALFAPHYAEYTTRLALALAETEQVLLVLDKKNRTDELTPALLEAARRATTLFEFRRDSRLSRRLSRLTVAWRILVFRPDVIHVQEQPDPLTSIVVATLRHLVPIALTVHDPKPHAGRDTANAMRWDRYRQDVRRAASLYHVNGRYCAGLMAEVGVPGRPVVTTFHGVILTPDGAGVASPTERRVLFFGRMEEYKGLDVLLEAVRELNGRGVALDLVLAGRGPELDRLDPAIRCLPNVTVVNRYLTPGEAVDEFQRATVVVLPYREATQSGVVAAAFANGRPVVASEVGGLVDVVRHEVNGLFVPPGSVLALADALHRVLDDAELRTRLAEGAGRTGLTTLSWRAAGNILSAAYHGMRRLRHGVQP